MNCHPDPELAEGEESPYFAQSDKKYGSWAGNGVELRLRLFCIGNSLHLLQPFMHLIAA
jgi:hypothetical protein